MVPSRKDLITAFSMLNKEDQNRGKLICDLYMMLDPYLAISPFDKPEKSFSNRIIKESKLFSH